MKQRRRRKVIAVLMAVLAVTGSLKQVGAFDYVQNYVCDMQEEFSDETTQKNDQLSVEMSAGDTGASVNNETKDQATENILSEKSVIETESNELLPEDNSEDEKSVDVMQQEMADEEGIMFGDGTDHNVNISSQNIETSDISETSGDMFTMLSENGKVPELMLMEEFSYTLILKAMNENKEELSVNLGYNTCYTLPENLFVYEGMELTGWNTRKDGSGTMYRPGEEIIRLSEEDQSTVILYGQWEAKRDLITVSFDSCGGTEVLPVVIERGGTVTSLMASQKEGYTFMGWYLEPSDGEKVTDSTVFAEDTVLYAQWNRNPVVIFDSNGGGPENIERMVSYGSMVGELPVYQSGANLYMSFIGWFTDAVQGEQVDKNRIITEDVIFYAHWGWKPVFNANGGHITQGEDFPLQESSQYVLEWLPEAQKDGYSFAGWYLADGVTQVLAGDCVDLSQGKEIKAHWVRTEIVRISLDPNGGTVWNSSENAIIEAEAGKPVEELPVPVKSKYVPYPVNRTVTYRFTGWLGEDGIFYDQKSCFTTDMVLTAQWEERSIKVTFDADGGSGLSSSVVYIAEGNSISVLPGAKKVNYILEGWYTQKEGQGEKLTAETEIYEDTIYYAYWVPFSMNASDVNAMYTYGAQWSNASNTNVDNVNDNLNFHPSDSRTQTAQLHVRFELNQSVGEMVLPAGAVQIRIPRYVWKDWDGNYTGTDNISANLPEYPSVRDGMWFSYMKDGDDYVIINSVEMTGGAGVDFTVSYSAAPLKIPGGAVDENGEYVEGYEFYQGSVPVTFSVDKELDGISETEAQKLLTIEMHTRIKTSATKKYSGVTYCWNSQWGTKPSDAEEYFYITWKCSEAYKSVTNQPSEFMWSEDTVHDGTVIYQSQKSWVKVSSNGTFYNTVVTRHPVSLLADIPETGLELRNEVIVMEKWKSGYETSNRVSAATVIYPAEYPEGVFDKQRSGGKQMIVSGGQEDIVDDKKEVQMVWELLYDGSTNDSPIWDENTQTCLVPNRTIRICEGNRGDLMYSSGSAASRYIWEPDTGNISLSDEDYYFSQIQIKLTEYDARQVNGVWTDRYIHEDTSLIEGVDIWVRYKNTDIFVYYQTVYPGNGLSVSTLPQGCVGFEVRHGTEFYSTKLSVTAYMNLKPTQKIQTLIKDDISGNVTSIFKNKGSCDIWKTAAGEDGTFFHATNYKGSSNTAYKEIYELKTSSTKQFSSKYTSSQGNVLFDVDRGTQDNPVAVSGWNYNTSYRLKRIKTGIFYDLLPAGTSVDTDTVFGIPIHNINLSSESYRGNIANNYLTMKESSAKLERGMYDIRFTDNWEGSQRTMMIIRFTIPDSVMANGVDFYYLLHNTYENVIENGTTVENDAAFVNTTKGAVLPEYRTHDRSVITEKEYYDSLEQQYQGYISYASASTNYIPVDAFSWGYNKSVKTLNDYEHAGETLLNREYTYRLAYSQSDYAVSSRIVFYDILEYGTQEENGICLSEWHGILKNINLKSVSGKLTDGSDTVHCAPVVYYSTKDRSAFIGSDYDIQNQETWSVTRPEDPSLITAVAIDCSHNEDGTDFVLKGRQAMEIYLTMQAPKEVQNVGKTAYNESVVYSQKGEDEQITPSYSDSSVTIRKVEPKIYKESVPAGGSTETPVSVETDEEIRYTVCIENPSDIFTLQDVTISDRISDRVNMDTSDIKIHFGDPDAAINISASPRASMKKNGRELQFIVSSLLPKEKVYLEIPVIVTAAEGLIENTACILSVDGIEKNINSDTIYHKVEREVYNLTVRKNVAGNMGDKTKEFCFGLKLIQDDSGTIPETIRYQKADSSEILYPDENGVFGFTLAHGESIIFKELPAGTAYEITEVDGEAQGYQVESENHTGIIAGQDRECIFTNTKNVSIPTNADTHTSLSTLFILLSGILVTVLRFMERR